MDINIDIHSNVNSVDKDVYLNILYDAGFVSCIDKYTRVTDVSKTCIDHIFVKHYDYSEVSSAILKTDLTDHYVVSAKSNYLATDTHLQMENSTYVDTTSLNELIQNQSWDEVLAQHDWLGNISCELFFNAFENMRVLASKQKLNSTRYKKELN